MESVTNLSVPSNASFLDSRDVACFNLSCSDVSEGVLTSQSLVCYGSNTILDTFDVTLSFHLIEETCVDVNVSVTPGRVFSHATPPPLALSFLKTNYDLIGNDPYAVVTNTMGVTVGRIQSDMTRLDVLNLTDFSVFVEVSACVLKDPNAGEGEKSGEERRRERGGGALREGVVCMIWEFSLEMEIFDRWVWMTFLFGKCQTRTSQRFAFRM